MNMNMNKDGDQDKDRYNQDIRMSYKYIVIR